MRAIIAVIAALGGGLLTAAFVVSAVHGDASETYGLLLGPLPFLAIGLAGYLRQPGRPVTWWLVGTGAAFGGDLSIGDVFLPMAENHWGSTNVVKHAGASEVEVSLERYGGTLVLVVRDDGCGFDLDRPRGLGLTGLSDRLDTVGGAVIITSETGLGTSVRVSIPVDSIPDSRERVEA